MTLSMSLHQATGVQFQFLSKWQRLVPPQQRLEFIEEFRRASTAAQVEFFCNQLNGNFVDGTGSVFLQQCINSH